MSQDTLSAVQRWMHDALVFPDKTEHARIDQYISSTSKQDARQRLGVYQRSYYLRILQCMREQFPALCHALGETLFTDFAREYLRTCPPESYTLYDLGRRFPGYLQESCPEEDADSYWVRFMLDLARYERRLFVLFDAPGSESEPAAELCTRDADLQLQSCFALDAYQFPVAWYYHEVRKGNQPEVPPPQHTLLAMVRTNFLTHTYPLREPQYWFLRQLQSGCTVDEAITQVAQQLKMPRAEVEASWQAVDGIRRRWIEAGFFVVREQ